VVVFVAEITPLNLNFYVFETDDGERLLCADLPNEQGAAIRVVFFDLAKLEPREIMSDDGMGRLIYEAKK
jgi:hypothetical protein